MRDETGAKVLTWRSGAAIRRHHQTLPRAREVFLTIRRPPWDWGVVWRPWKGFLVFSRRRVSDHGDPLAWAIFQEIHSVPMPKRKFDTSNLVPDDLPSESKLLHKCPLLRQFITARSYEGGGVRLPGRFWFEAGSLGFAITLIDVDNALRCVVRAGAIDDVFAAAELLLGAENGPWEVDQFQADRKAKKPKK